MAKVALVSRVNYNTFPIYKGEKLLLPPKKKTKKEFDQDKLENINPNEIQIVK